MNNFIVSSKGFLQKVEYDETLKQKVFIWCDKLRDAQRCKSGAAKTLIENHNIDAFIWNPFKEEPVKNKWEVVKRVSYYDIFEEIKHNALEWLPRKVVMQSKTDAKFLNDKNIKEENLYSYEESVIIANEKNEKTIEELKSKIIKL